MFRSFTGVTIDKTFTESYMDMDTNDVSLLCHKRYYSFRQPEWVAWHKGGSQVACIVHEAKHSDSIFTSANILLLVFLLFLGVVIGLCISLLIPGIKKLHRRFKKKRQGISYTARESQNSVYLYESIVSLVTSGDQPSGSTQQTSSATCTAASSSSNTETVYTNNHSVYTNSPEQTYRNVSSIRTRSRELCRYDVALEMSYISHSRERPESSPKVCRQKSSTERYITPSTPPECRCLSFHQATNNGGENIGWSRDNRHDYTSSHSTSLTPSVSLTVEETDIDKSQSISSSSRAVDLQNSGHNVKDTANIISRESAAGTSFADLMTVSWSSTES